MDTQTSIEAGSPNRRDRSKRLGVGRKIAALGAVTALAAVGGKVVTDRISDAAARAAAEAAKTAAQQAKNDAATARSEAVAAQVATVAAEIRAGIDRAASAEQIGDLETAVREQQEAFVYAADLAGLDAEQVQAHLELPRMPEVTIAISPEVARAQDAATMYLLSFDMKTAVDDTALSTFACTVVKTGADTLTSAAHCFTNRVADNFLTPVPAKGGGGFVEPDNFVTSEELYVANRPFMSLGEARTSAARVTGFNRDHFSTDAASLVVGNTPEWFSAVAPLELRTETPAKGETLRVSGYPDGSSVPVAAEGVVLGELPPYLFGQAYGSYLTMVGIRPDANQLNVGSHGSSGGSAVDKDGRSFGAAAIIQRSDNPAGGEDVTPILDQMQAIERELGYRLADEDFILIGFAPVAPLEPKPLVTDPVLYAQIAPPTEGK